MTVADEKHYRTRITRREDFGPNLWMIRVQKPEGFVYAPGQYATIGVQRPEKRSERPYSMVSSPYQREIEFFFELVPEGELTPLLYPLQPGDEVLLRKIAKGRFTLNSDSATRSRHLLISTVTGVAPFVSFVRTLYREWKDGKFNGEQQLFLLNGASRSWEFGYHQELFRVARETPWLKYIPTVSRPWDDAAWPGETGRVDDLIRKYTDQWGLDGANSTGYICGHPQMIENAKGILKRIGFSREHLKEEIYWVPEKHAADKGVIV
jgi:ferredoxin--NADP+ reductase